jgi:2-amino-4-hydroxy-6-hydroxymethyldihydropteridine diphosphokinase
MAHLTEAAARIGDLQGVQLAAASGVYETEPVGEVPDQRDFLNAVVRIEAALPPLELLKACKAIEQEMGRVAGPRHGPRPIDIDLLMAAGEEVESPQLSLPHPEVKARRFVLVPLLELEPPDAAALRAALQALPPGQRAERVGALIPR